MISSEPEEGVDSDYKRHSGKVTGQQNTDLKAIFAQ